MLEWLLVTLILMVLVTFPVKLGASLLGARRTRMWQCALAVVLGLFASLLCLRQLPGGPALLAAYLAIAIVYWIVLGPSLLAALLLPVAVLLIQIAVVQGLLQLGLLAGG